MTKPWRVCHGAVVVAPPVDEAPRVMVVSREDAMLELLEHIFQRAGIESVSASSIATALRAFDAQDIAVMVVDSYGIQLPVELTDRVRSAVVVLTSDDLDEAQTVRASRRIEYVRKPFSGEALVSRVRAHLGRRQAGLAVAIAER
jgi:DNA-binding response OmpR family regulator